MEDHVSKLLEELIRETSTEPGSAEELAERLKSIRTTLLKLLDAAPLLALASQLGQRRLQETPRPHLPAQIRGRP